MQCVFSGNLDAVDDNILVSLAQSGNSVAEEALIARYKKIAKAKARTYFMAGADHDDVIQEGLIGLHEAIRDFRRGGGSSSFSAFANLCVTRQVLSAVKSSCRKKHVPLNSSASLDEAHCEEGYGRSISMLDVVSAPEAANPEKTVVFREEFFEIKKKMVTCLSFADCRLLACYLAGNSYKEMADKTGRDIKAVDNALARIKRKLRRHAGKVGADSLIARLALVEGIMEKSFGR